MGKTHRNIGYSYMRRPKGARQAKAAGARAVPPNSWHDLGYAAEGEFHQPVKRYLQSQVGRSWGSAFSHIREKWGEHAARVAAEWVRPGPRYLRPGDGPFVDSQGVLRLWPFTS